MFSNLTKAQLIFSFRTLLFSILLAFLPVLPKVSTITILVVFVFTLIVDGKNISFSYRYKTPQIFIFLLFVLYLIGVIYSDNQNFAWKDIEARLTFLVFPLLFFLFPSANDINKRALFLSFVLGCIVSSILSYIKAYDCFQSHGWEECWASNYLAYGIHINYLSIYYATAILFSWAIFCKIRWTYIFKVILTSWFLYFIWRFDSLGAMLSVLGMVLIIMIYYLINTKGLQKKVLVVTAILLGVIGSSLLFPRVKKYYETNYQYFHSQADRYQYVDKTRESILVRAVVWEIAIKEAAIYPFGVGTGDVKDHLIQKYKENGLYNLAEKKLNPHNQFLQTGVAIGWMGVISLILLQIGLIYRGFRTKNLLLISFVTLCFLNMMFESFLERQAGIVFFSLLIFILDYKIDHYSKNKSSS